MPSFSGQPVMFDINPFESGTVQKHELGALAFSKDGRKFRYAKNGASAMAAGKLYQTSAIAANHVNLSVAAAAIGATQVTITLGNTAATANQYAGGYLHVNDGTGEGHTYQIDSHPAADASATLLLTLKDKIKVALVASGTSECSLVANPYNGLVIMPTTITGAPAGWAVFAVPASEYCWIQTGGVLSALQDGTPAAGAALSPSNAVAGAVESGVIGQGVVANALQTGVDTEYQMIFAILD